MATAVSLKCKSGFDYLELFKEGSSIGDVVMQLEHKFGIAWETIEIVRVKSTEVNIQELRMSIDQSISNLEQTEVENR